MAENSTHLVSHTLWARSLGEHGVDLTLSKADIMLSARALFHLEVWQAMGLLPSSLRLLAEFRIQFLLAGRLWAQLFADCRPEAHLHCVCKASRGERAQARMELYVISPHHRLTSPSPLPDSSGEKQSQVLPTLKEREFYQGVRTRKWGPRASP